MKIKVCGIKYEQNIREIIELGVDYIGLNFYAQSPRFYSGSGFDINKKQCKLVGLFVDESIEFVTQKIELHGLDIVQLHGKENPVYCESLSSKIETWKAIPHTKIFDTNLIQSYSMCSKLLFDTAGEKFGGSGEKFDWDELNKYSNSIPYFLAGGVDTTDANEIIKFNNSDGFYGVDINSKFEISPGLKDSSKIKEFLKKIKI